MIKKLVFFMLRKSPIVIFISILIISGCKSIKNIQNDKKEFIKIFDGSTLNGWEGDSAYWRIENGNLVGEVTLDNILKRNSFIIWRGGLPSDFELKVEYRITREGNSGINYRSEEIEDLPYALKGYQADIDGANRYTGQNYEERGRTFLARCGEKVLLEDNKKLIVLATLISRDTMSNFIKSNDWNECHLTVKGNRMQHYVNGVLISDVTDNDESKRKFSGLLGVQVHIGPPMKIEYRNFRLWQ